MPPLHQPVIIVEDDGAVRNALKFALEQEGMKVRVYSSGAELLATTLPSTGCLVLDYHLPGMDGLEVLDRLRRAHVALPAILITTKITGAMRQRAMLFGVRQLLEKPLNDSALVDGIRAAMSAV